MPELTAGVRRPWDLLSRLYRVSDKLAVERSCPCTPSGFGVESPGELHASANTDQSLSLGVLVLGIGTKK